MSTARERDEAMLLELDHEQLMDLFFHQIRNIFRVDGLYFLGIEERFGTAAATEVDAECWRTMATLEARNLRRMLGLGDGLDDLARGLRLTSWALDHQEKDFIQEDARLTYRVMNCRTQTTRLKKGLGEFPCRQVRQGYLEAFAAVFGAQVECRQCPPDPHPGEVWCEWVFRRND